MPDLVALLRAQGLAYSVSGGFDTPIDHVGLFTAGGETAAPAKFLAQLQRVLKVPPYPAGGTQHCEEKQSVPHASIMMEVLLSLCSYSLQGFPWQPC